MVTHCALNASVNTFNKIESLEFTVANEEGVPSHEEYLPRSMVEAIIGPQSPDLNQKKKKNKQAVPQVELPPRQTSVLGVPNEVQKFLEVCKP